MSGGQPRVLFVGSLYAGHRTRFLNLRAHAERDPRIDAAFYAVSGWRDGGLVERSPLPRTVRGRLRATIEARPLARLPRPDAIWTAVNAIALPHLWAQIGPLRRPLVLDLDWTLDQQEELAPTYFGRPAKRGLRRALATTQERLLWSRVSIFTPWSNWAAAALRARGIADERLRVIPPGVDLDAWRADRGCEAGARPLRVLFVGADLVRKGGDMLVELARSRFADSCEFHFVTPANVPTSVNVHVHRATANSPELRALYRDADLFMMPSRAECFGIATVEAMASGLPVIVGDVGGARDIVDDGVTGWLVEPEVGAAAAALDRALEHRDGLPAMGMAGRKRAEQRFDGTKNDAAVVDLLVELTRGG